jgi:hypothetical protein
MIDSIPTPIFTRVNVPEGCTLNGLYGISGPLLINYYGTTQPCMTFQNETPTTRIGFFLEKGAMVQCSGTQPFYYLNAPIVQNSAEFIMFSASSVLLANGIDTIPPSQTFFPPLKTDGTIMIIVLFDGSNFADNAVVSGAATQLGIIRGSTSVTISIPLAQSGVGGSFFYGDTTHAPIIHQFAAAPTVNSDQTAGFKVGDSWIDTATQKFYTCVDSSTGAAIWNGPY